MALYNRSLIKRIEALEQAVRPQVVQVQVRVVSVGTESPPGTICVRPNDGWTSETDDATRDPREVRGAMGDPANRH
jgi:hypothetical protein